MVPVVGNDVHPVFMVFVECVNHFRDDIEEAYLVPALRKHLSNKSAANVARTVHNCFFHCDPSGLSLTHILFIYFVIIIHKICYKSSVLTISYSAGFWYNIFYEKE